MFKEDFFYLCTLDSHNIGNSVVNILRYIRKLERMTEKYCTIVQSDPIRDSFAVGLRLLCKKSDSNSTFIYPTLLFLRSMRALSHTSIPASMPPPVKRLILFLFNFSNSFYVGPLIIKTMKIFIFDISYLPNNI